MPRFLISLVLLASLYAAVLCLASDGHPLIFLDLPSIGVILLPVVFVLAASEGTAVISGLRAVFSRHGRRDALIQAVRFLRAARTTSLLAGAVAFMIGTVGMLSNISDPIRVGQALAVALLSVLYSLLLVLLLLQPLLMLAERRLAATDEGRGD